LDMIGIGQKELDITKEKDVQTFIQELKPDAIVHCAAYTAVDQAEDQKEICWNVNVNGTKYLAEAAKEVNAKFMFI
ncbi:sugar nucleotide-binding protein, partial [Anaerostipes hadrus]